MDTGVPSGFPFTYWGGWQPSATPTPATPGGHLDQGRACFLGSLWLMTGQWTWWRPKPPVPLWGNCRIVLAPELPVALAEVFGVSALQPNSSLPNKLPLLLWDAASESTSQYSFHKSLTQVSKYDICCYEWSKKVDFKMRFWCGTICCLSSNEGPSLLIWTLDHCSDECFNWW